jgi:hypothetical protein
MAAKSVLARDRRQDGMGSFAIRVRIELLRRTIGLSSETWARARLKPVAGAGRPVVL